MVVALLVLIVLILLFGAGVVKGWLTNIIGLGCGGVAILMALLWVGSFFGPDGFRYIVYGLLGITGLLVVSAVLINQWEKAKTAPSPVPSTRPIRPAPQAPRLEPRDLVWSRNANDISLRFSPESRAKAAALYDQDDVDGLERFCKSERRRPTR